MFAVNFQYQHHCQQSGRYVNHFRIAVQSGEQYDKESQLQQNRYCRKYQPLHTVFCFFPSFVCTTAHVSSRLSKPALHLLPLYRLSCASAAFISTFLCICIFTSAYLFASSLRASSRQPMMPWSSCNDAGTIKCSMSFNSSVFT